MSDKHLPHSADPKTLGRTPWFSLLTSLILLGLALSLAGSPVQAQAPANLLRNPGFEGDYFAWSGIPEIQVAHDWTPWWVAQTSSDPPEINRRPEYKQANAALYANRVHSGSAAQQWFTFHSTHIAGMYQQACNIQPGTRLQFSIWAQVWSSSDDNPYESVSPGVINLQVGIDPTGNWDPWAGTVVWSGQYNFYDAWGQLVVEAVAQSDTVTVFMKSAPKYPVKHNDTYWDDAALIVMGDAPPPPATPTPNPEIVPTDPAATATLSPTAAPPTASSTPTATCTPPPADWVPYLVQSGDYLTALSVAFDVSLDEIIAANCLNRTNLYAGETLLLPPRPPTPTPPPATATATQPPAAEPSPSETATPATSPTPVQVAAATLTSSPVLSATPAATSQVNAENVTGTPVAAEEPAELAATATPASGGGLGGLCGASLAPNLLIVGIVLLARRKRAP